MNSSTNPPSSTRKYQFDTDFDAEEERRLIEALAHQEQEAHQYDASQHAAQHYSGQELEQARGEAFQAGFENGLKEATQAIENTLNSAINALIVNISGLLEGEEARWKMTQETALRTTMATIKKIWPAIVKKLGQDAVEATLRQSMDYNPEETRIVVRVHDTILDAIVQRLPQLKEQHAFAGKVIIIADEKVQAGDCKIEWADGGLERLSRTLSANLDDAMDRILANISSHMDITDRTAP
ncbi:MAG: putative Flagellar biosynthesis protein [Alphaproteobacteria bacterium]|nr:putative Flagellar biosynthesis protein [Alphaproteobacteria bacterium]